MRADGAASILKVTASYNACVPQSFSDLVIRGTEITNPMARASAQLVTSACQVIGRCHANVNKVACLAGLMTTPGMGAPLGLAENFSTLLTISEAESSGALVANHVVGNG